MAWSLLGVVVIELLLLLESLISVIWRLLVKGIKNLHIVDNKENIWLTANIMAKPSEIKKIM